MVVFIFLFLNPGLPYITGPSVATFCFARRRAVRTDIFLRFSAPKNAVVILTAVIHRFAAQVAARQLQTNYVLFALFHPYACVAAASTARFTAVFTNCTL